MIVDDDTSTEQFDLTEVVFTADEQMEKKFTNTLLWCSRMSLNRNDVVHQDLSPIA